MGFFPFDGDLLQDVDNTVSRKQLVPKWNPKYSYIRTLNIIANFEQILANFFVRDFKIKMNMMRSLVLIPFELFLFISNVCNNP